MSIHLGAPNSTHHGIYENIAKHINMSIHNVREYSLQYSVKPFLGSRNPWFVKSLVCL